MKITEVLQSATSRPSTTQPINEAFVNIFKRDLDLQDMYGQQVCDIITAAYAAIGGNTDASTLTVDGLKASFPMWKLYVSGGVVKFVMLFKDRQGRKLTALGTDGSREASLMLRKQLPKLMDTAYGELSGDALRLFKIALKTRFQDHQIPNTEVAGILNIDPSEIELHPDGFSYTRNIDGKRIEKQMIGTHGLPIVDRT